MKRMYGDIKHISVLKNEFDGNYIESDEVEYVVERYSKGKQERAMKIDPKKNRRSDTIAEPHFRLQSTTTAGTTSTTQSTKATSTATTTRPSTTLKTEDPQSLKDKYTVENETKSDMVSDFIESMGAAVEESVTVVTLKDNSTSSSVEPPTVSPIITTTSFSSSATPSTTQTLLSQEISLEELEGHKEDDDDLDYTDRSPHPLPTMEGQLFQDTVKDKESATPVNTRGV